MSRTYVILASTKNSQTQEVKSSVGSTTMNLIKPSNLAIRTIAHTKSQQAFPSRIPVAPLYLQDIHVDDGLDRLVPGMSMPTAEHMMKARLQMEARTWRARLEEGKQQSSTTNTKLHEFS
eukprot:6491436-Amphidinium_carterae.1